MLLKACHEILVLEVIGDSCSRQRVGTVGKGLVVFITSSNCQRVGSVHYQFKLPLEVFIWEGNNLHTTKYRERYSIALP